MDLSKYHLNFASVKRRGYDESTYQYIYTVHSFPVRMSGYEDIEYLKEVNQRFVYGYEPGQSEDESVRYAASLCRSRSRVLQLAFNNKWDYFVTLTFDKDKIDRYDYKAICSSMLKFFDNYKQRKSKDFKYLLIPEQHKDGAFHFHGYFSGIKPGDVRPNEWGYLDFVPYRKKFGFCSISEIEDREKCAVYVSKYITKDMFNSTPPPRTHLYFASRGLKFDEVISVGHAPTALVPPAESVQFSCQFCHKYVSDSNIFWMCLSKLFEEYKRHRRLSDFRLCQHPIYPYNHLSYFLTAFYTCLKEPFEVLLKHRLPIKHYLHPHRRKQRQMQI